METILEIKNLNVSVQQKKEWHEILKGVSLKVGRGECIGILGESGSGKSMTMKAAMGILDRQFKTEGVINFKGNEISKLSSESRRRMRGREMTMIMQQPMTAFDPLYTIGYQMEETLLTHGIKNRRERLNLCSSIIEKMCIPNATKVLSQYPYQLSGGMLQRVMIGLAMTLKPDVIIADEPTTAIDAITQYQILSEFKKIAAEGNTSVVFISHDIGVLSHVASRIYVMNSGRVVDSGELSQLKVNAKDNYTRKLLKTYEQLRCQYDVQFGKEAVC